MNTQTGYKGNEVINGRYVRFSIRENFLRVYVNKDGRDYIKDNKNDKNDDSVFIDLIEDFLGNGWTIVQPEQMHGDLRSDEWLVLSRDFTYASEDDDDELIVGKAYSYSQYATEGYLAPLVRKGYVDFELHEYLTPQLFEYTRAQRCPWQFETNDEKAERERILEIGKALLVHLDAEEGGQKPLSLGGLSL